MIPAVVIAVPLFAKAISDGPAGNAPKSNVTGFVAPTNSLVVKVAVVVVV